jgi:hypothetical protein
MNSRRIALVLAALAFSTSADARLIAAPSYQELLDKSDLVVIAAPTASRDTQERTDLPGITTVTAQNKSVGFPVVGVETRFRVAAVLKGRAALKEFVLHHYREADPQPTINGPALVSFEPSKNRSFLLFLVRGKDGRYVPTAGQTDPGFLSIHSLGAFVR